MIKNITYILFICFATQVFSQDTNTLKEYALRDANAACVATVKEDFKTLLSYTHPNILEAAGGLEVMQNYLETTFKDMKANGFKYEIAETKSVSNVIKEQGEYRCYVENYNVMVMNNKRIFSTSYMLGFYIEADKKWAFVEAKEMKEGSAMAGFFPDFKTELVIPENTMKMEDIKK